MLRKGLAFVLLIRVYEVHIVSLLLRRLTQTVNQFHVNNSIPPLKCHNRYHYMLPSQEDNQIDKTTRKKYDQTSTSGHAAVERWLVDRAVLPIENSLGGSIHRNYDLLLRHRLHIVGEVKLAIRHCLLANHGAKIEDLNRVLSHPQALAQCENTLTKWGLVREAVDDTAGAAKYIAFQNIKDAGAVASEAAAKIYGLDILALDIQDDSDNITRFLMLAREPIIPGVDKPFKTSIVFSLEEGPGTLFKALAVFAMRNINLTKIESRPLQKQALRELVHSTSGLPKYGNFPYLFYVDFEASMADQRAQNALGHLEEFATFLRVLGSYPADTASPEIVSTQWKKFPSFS